MKTLSHKKKMGNTQITEIYECVCTGRKYSSRTSYKAHLRSEKHRHFLLRKELKELKEELTRKEIKLGKKKQKIEILEKTNLALLNELAAMKGKKRRRKSKRKKNIQDID